ncbi:MAG: hypothetical protein OEV66_12025 [Spirochaetia bacterium]|nr:hypothetical protein [Spirochaetia bacterium]
MNKEARKKMMARLRELRRQYIEQGGVLLSREQILEELKQYG